jgi:signal transduction histidine kinase/DNA-binding NarL/FixJ family response regulator
MLVAVSVISAYSKGSQLRLIMSEEWHNAALGRSIANTLWPTYSGYLTSVSDYDGDKLRARPETERLDTELRRITSGLSVLKVKIYQPNGMTIYSSELDQIGQSKFGDGKFGTALRKANVVSNLGYRASFSSFSGQRTAVDLVETYVPITDETGRILLMVELYTDVSQAVAAMQQDTRQFTFIMLGAFALLFIALYYVARRVDTSLVHEFSNLSSFNDSLEQRVKERTAAADAAVKLARRTSNQISAEIEERRRIEQELIQKQMRLTLQQSGLSDFIRNDKLTRLGWERAIQALMEMTSTTLEMSRASTWLFTPDRSAIQCVDLYELQGGKHSSGSALQRCNFPTYFAALESESFIAADDALVDPRTSEFRASYLLPHGISSMLDVPIVRDGQVEGAICIEHIGEQVSWSPDQQVFAAAVASLAAVVLEGRDRMLVEQALRSTNRALEAATNAKSEFLATMSHEIRTPMNGVLGTLELLLDTELTAPQKHLTVTARRSAESLLGILNDILDYSKLEAAKVELEIVDFSPEQVVDDIVSLFLPRASAKGLSIDVSIADDVPLWLAGDQTRLRQVLSNLVGNAVKFTEDGGVSVACSIRTAGAGQLLARFEIFDTGIGIPADGVGRLFTRFSQTDSSTTRRFGGTGLGLAISKQIVQLMGGQIGVVTDIGEGCTFWFEVPVGVGRQPQPFMADSDVPLTAKPLRILVADDNRVNRMIAQMLLAKYGHAVETVVNGREAVDAVRKSDYDLVLMDVQMPEMDGLTATAQIRSLDEPRRSIKIIALTANAMTGQREEYIANGMNDYVSKPINSKLLFSAIERATRGAVALSDASPIALMADTDRRRTSRRRSDAAAEFNSLPVFDRSVIAAWSAGMDKADVGATLECVPDESVRSLNEIKAAIGAGDLKEAKRIAHRMKGMASNLGASRLAAVARSIEIDAASIETASARLNLLAVTTDATLLELRAIA